MYILYMYIPIPPLVEMTAKCQGLDDCLAVSFVPSSG